MKKKISSRVIVILIALILVIQFFRPERNTSSSVSQTAIEQQYAISEEVQGILKTSCYDCHSNNTVYPWYSNIQPFAWWQQNHVNEGKKELNFDEFGNYDVKKKKHKLEEFLEMLEKDEMHLGSYTLVHQ